MRCLEGMIKTERVTILAGFLLLGMIPGVVPAAEDDAPPPQRLAPADGEQAIDAALPDKRPAGLPAGPVVHRERLRMTTLRGADEQRLMRGARGLVRQGKHRLAYDALVEETANDARLAEYRERRCAAAPTVAGQLALAEWCRRQRLSDQERAHLTAVVGLEPDHPLARQRLRHVRQGRDWFDADELAAGHADARAAAAARRTHAAALDRLAKRIGDGDVSSDEAVARIADLGRRAGLAAIEAHLSAANEPAAMAVVRWLNDQSGDEVAVSLVRHALSSHWRGVRLAATGALRERERDDYVPLLLAAFNGRWTSEIDWRVGPDGNLMWRVTAAGEGATERIETAEEHLIVPVGVVERAQVEAIRQAAILTLDHASRKETLNRQTTLVNEAIATVLRGATGEVMSDEPEVWRTWWSEQTGTPAGSWKPTERYYRSSWSYAEGVATARPTIISKPSPGEPTLTMTRQTFVFNASTGSLPFHCCLAGGTVVWTNIGPVAVDRLQPGDVLLTQDERTGELRVRPVLAVTMRPPEKVLVLHADGTTIRATAGHPFWVVDKGWTLACEIEPGFILHGLDGGTVIERIEEEADPVRTFNLVVDDDHSFFCGEAKVLSHDVTPLRSTAMTP